jgi:hypothetical protein
MYCSLRGLHVQKMIHSLALDGIQVKAAHMILLNTYVEETISGLDLLAHAHEFNTTAAYYEWWLSLYETLIGTPELNISVDFVISEFGNSVRSRYISDSHII